MPKADNSLDGNKKPLFFLTVRFPFCFLDDYARILEAHPDSMTHQRKKHVFYATDSKEIAKALLTMFAPKKRDKTNALLDSIYTLVDGSTLSRSERVRFREAVENLEGMGDPTEPGFVGDRELRLTVGAYRRAKGWESLLRDELGIAATSAAGSKRKEEDATGEKQPDDPIPTAVAVAAFLVSRSTLRRYVADGKIKAYRPLGAPRNGKIVYSKKALASCFPAKKQES